MKNTKDLKVNSETYYFGVATTTFRILTLTLPIVIILLYSFFAFLLFLFSIFGVD